MKETSSAYVPRDRLIALANRKTLLPKAEGSVLFADISGFTPLTEAFEKHLGARHGAEELTRVLNEVYAFLIQEVERMRGSVLGFAGDAITCWFNEDDGARAVSCALAMQSGMEKFKDIPSPDGGTAPLGLKAAVTFGTVKRFVVGKRDIQLVDVMAGDPVYRVAEVEQLCEKGEVRIDRQTFESLQGRISATFDESKPDRESTYIVHSIKELPEISPWPDLDQIPVTASIVSPWMIASIRERLNSGLGEFLTELRPASAMFVKFEGINFEDDDEADKKLNQFFSAVQSIVDEYGGVVHQLTVGDKGSFLYAAFGAPVSHEDDTRRSLASALKLQKLKDSMKFIESIQIGITRGSTRTGAYGGPTRRTYGVLGDQVNLSARLMAKAGPGQIFVSAEAAKEGNRSFNFKKLPSVRVKGKTHPVEVYLLESAREGGRKTVYSVPMVGRKEELSELSGYLNLSKKGLGQIVSIVSEAGMGKSRLIAECIQVSKNLGFRVLSGECQSFGSKSMYAPWWSVWREFFGLESNESTESAQVKLNDRLKEIDPRLIPRLPLLGPVLNLSLPDNELTKTFDAKLRRASLEGLLIDCMRHWATDTPILIVLEEVQAIDSLSLELLKSFVQSIARQPVMILLANRPSSKAENLTDGTTPLDYVHSIELKEFSREESTALIKLKAAKLFGEQIIIPEAVLSRIFERTGGNPYFIEEIINWIHHNQVDINSASALDDGNLPSSLYSLVLTRMDQLDENSRVTMKVASVIGRVFRAALIWGVYPDLGNYKDVLAALENLSNENFTAPAEDEAELAYLFKHIVMHEVAYESIPKSLRSKLHGAIGLFIEQHFSTDTTNIYDLLAFHFGRSQDNEKKLHYYLLAGDASRKAYANDSAAEYYRSALPMLKEADKVSVLLNLGQVLEFKGDWEEAMEIYLEALNLSGKHNNRHDDAKCRLRIGDMLRKKGTFDESLKWLTEARNCFEQLDEEKGIGQVLHCEGTLAAQSGDYSTAKDIFSKSMEIRRRLHDQPMVASLLSNIGIIERFQGDIDAALRLQEESLEIRRELKEPWAIGNSLNNRGMAKRYKGDLEGAMADLIEALELLEKVGDRAEIANTLNSLAEIALDQEDVVASESYLKKSLQLSRELGNLYAITFIFEAFASIAFLQKDYWRCLRLSGKAKALRESIGAPLPQADSDRIKEMIAQASAGMAHGDPLKVLEEGSALPISTALDYAAGLEDSEL